MTLLLSFKSYISYILLTGLVFLWISFLNPVYKATTAIVFPLQENLEINQIYTNTQHGYIASPPNLEPYLGLNINNYNTFTISNIAEDSSIVLLDQKNQHITSFNAQQYKNSVYEINQNTHSLLVNNVIYKLTPSHNGHQFALIVTEEPNKNNLSIYVSNIYIHFPASLKKFEIASTNQLIVAFSKKSNFIIEKSIFHKNYIVPKIDLNHIQNGGTPYFNYPASLDDLYLDIKYPNIDRFHLSNFNIDKSFFFHTKLLNLIIFVLSMLLSSLIIYVWHKRYDIISWVANLNRESKIFLAIIISFWSILSLYFKNILTPYDDINPTLIMLGYTDWYSSAYYVLQHIFILLNYSSRTMIIAFTYIFTIWMYRAILIKYIPKKIIVYILLLPFFFSPVLLFLVLHAQRSYVTTIILLCGIMCFFYNYFIHSNKTTKYLVSSYFILLVATLLRPDYIFYMLVFFVLQWKKSITYCNTLIFGVFGMLSLIIIKWSTTSMIPTLIIICIASFGLLLPNYIFINIKNKLIDAKKYIITTLLVLLIILYIVISSKAKTNYVYQNTSYCRIAIPFIYMNYDKLSASDLAFVHEYLKSNDDTYIKNTIAYKMNALNKGDDIYCQYITHIKNKKQLRDLKHFILSQTIQDPLTLLQYKNILFNKLISSMVIRYHTPISVVIPIDFNIIVSPTWSNNAEILNPYFKYFNTPILKAYFNVFNPLVYITIITFIVMCISIFFILQIPLTATLSIIMALRMLVVYLMAPAPYSLAYIGDVIIFFNFIFILIYIEWTIHRKSKLITS